MSAETIIETAPPVRQWPARDLTGVEFDPVLRDLMDDGPVTRLRRSVASAFTARGVERVREKIPADARHPRADGRPGRRPAQQGRRVDPRARGPAGDPVSTR